MLIKLYGLAYACPKGKIRDKDCPLLEIEHLSFEKKINWIDELDEDKKETILRHHSYCTKKEIIKLHHE